MKIYHRYENLPENVMSSVIAIGNFDGVHIGHQKILEKAKDIANTRKKPFNVLTFEPHPYSFFTSQKNNFRITSLHQKAEFISESGADNLIVVKFDKPFSEISATNFVKNVLVDKLHISSVVVGKGFEFGHNHVGNTKFLSEKGKTFGFDTYETEPQMNTKRDERVSSSMIRTMIAGGEVKKAKEMLGRPFEMEGLAKKCENDVIFKFFPTLCLTDFDNYILPRKGVYSSKIGFLSDNENSCEYVWYDAVTEFGRYTFSSEKNDEDLAFATHIMGNIPDLKEDLRNRKIKVRLYDFLRPEIRSDSLENHIKDLIVDTHWSRIILEQERTPDMPVFVVGKP